MTTIHGNPYQFRGYCFPAATAKIFSTELGGSRLAVDGGYRVRSESISILNLDSTAQLLFSFDSTSFNQLDAGAGFSDSKLATDRIFIKCGSTDSSCYLQMTASLQNNWK